MPRTIKRGTECGIGGKLYATTKRNTNQKTHEGEKNFKEGGKAVFFWGALEERIYTKISSTTFTIFSGFSMVEIINGGKICSHIRMSLKN